MRLKKYLHNISDFIIFSLRQTNFCNENWHNENIWKPHLVLLCFDSFRFSRENYYVLPSGMKYVLRLGACRCWEPNILCFAGDTRKDCQGMWINSCWCRPLTVFPLIWHARGIYQKETTSSKHFTNLNGFDTSYLMFYLIKNFKFDRWVNLAE